MSKNDIFLENNTEFSVPIRINYRDCVKNRKTYWKLEKLSITILALFFFFSLSFNPYRWSNSASPESSLGVPQPISREIRLTRD